MDASTGRQTAILLVGRDDGTPEEVAALTDQLRADLIETGSFDIRRPEVEGRPDGAKGDAMAWAELAASFSGGLPTLVTLIRSWVGRGQGRTVELQIGGDTLKVGGVSPEEQERLVTAWLERHVDNDG